MHIVTANENICRPALSNPEELNTPHADICQAYVTLAKHEPRQGHRDAASVALMKEQDQATQQSPFQPLTAP